MSHIGEELMANITQFVTSIRNKDPCKSSAQNPCNDFDPQQQCLYYNQENLKGESVEAAILPSHVEGRVFFTHKSARLHAFRYKSTPSTALSSML